MISTSLSFALYSSVTTVLVKMEVHTCQGRTWMACGNFRKTLKKKGTYGGEQQRPEQKRKQSIIHLTRTHIYQLYIITKKLLLKARTAVVSV